MCGRVMFVHSQQGRSFLAVARRRRPSQVHLGWNFASDSVIHKKGDSKIFHVDLMQDTFRDNAALRGTKFTDRVRFPGFISSFANNMKLQLI